MLRQLLMKVCPSFLLTVVVDFTLLTLFCSFAIWTLHQTKFRISSTLALTASKADPNGCFVPFCLIGLTIWARNVAEQIWPFRLSLFLLFRHPLYPLLGKWTWDGDPSMDSLQEKERDRAPIFNGWMDCGMHRVPHTLRNTPELLGIVMRCPMSLGLYRGRRVKKFN